MKNAGHPHSSRNRMTSEAICGASEFGIDSNLL
jgi:hypothetical protein